MRKELFETGKTVDAAIDSACEKLGCLREDCEWEIIDLPKKGFLGLKNIPAKVRVSIEVPDEKPVKTQKTPQPEVRYIQREIKPQAQKTLKNQQPEKIQQIEKPQQSEKSQQVVNPQFVESGEKNRREKQAPIQPRTFKRSVVLNPEEISEKEVKAKDYIASVLEAAGLKADFEISREHGGSYINIVGEGLGMVIGRRGETLDALQYLAGLVANRAEGDYLRLTVDCGDYRIKRKGTLEALAKKLANQVLKTNVSKTLEPMNPFERRIIHATVSEIEGVSSSSIGEEPNRRVIITSPTAKPASRSGYHSDREIRGEREFRGDRTSSRGAYSKGRGSRGSSDLKVEVSGETESVECVERGGYGRDKSDKRGRDGRRGGGRPRQAQPVTQGPPKQTPESEKTAGISFGKIDL